MTFDEGIKYCERVIDHFARYLQKELDTLGEYFPEERKQCEIIWKPVYDEYRRLGYRLKDKGVNNE